MNISSGFWSFISNSVYVALAIDALWGAYCAAVVLMRVRQKRFRSEKQQNEFLDRVDASLSKGDFDTVAMECETDQRALPQLAALACANRHLEVSQIQELLVDRFQRDVLADLEHRVSWINNVIKTAPMLGLLGTVLGMMAAFAKLASSQSVKPDQLASDISFALITTAIGLAIAIPGTICVAAVNVRIRKLEDLVGAGLARLLDSVAVGQRFLPRRGK
ncbi:MAG: MotA/TolQ/ExbB proton channel family protein [Pirellulaceae bacterium]|jgi:biopolymer transport protein ExbB/TolQ|nr:MotA/TolQ/ExbB proton channel family protein [Pirellulaceae bacterium]